MNAYILAGGLSRRFGKNKALVEIKGKPLILFLYEMVSQYFPTFVVVKNPEKYKKFSFPIIKDIKEIQAPKVGIYTALKHSSETFNLILSVDLPLFSTKYLEFLKNYSFEEKIHMYLPFTAGKYHFLCGVYNRSLLPILEEEISQEILSLKRTLQRVKHVIWTEEFLKKYKVPGNFCYNLNTKEEWEKLLQNYSF